ncbi:MAG: hypothetical protein KH135_01225 [Firmicutes bacterium]|nr:hypothetical protein [Bacillota bacterium]
MAMFFFYLIGIRGDFNKIDKIQKANSISKMIFAAFNVLGGTSYFLSSIVVKNNPREVKIIPMIPLIDKIKKID